MQPNERKEKPSSPKSPGYANIAKAADLPAGARLLTTAQFSLKYKLCRSTIYNRIKEGRLQAVKQPGKNSKDQRRPILFVVDPGWEHYTIPNHNCTPADEIYVLNGKEVAELLGCSPRWVRYLATADKLGFSKTSTKDRGHRRFSIADVRKMMAIRATGKRRPSRGAVRSSVLQWARERLGARDGT